MALSRAVAALQKGSFVLVHDESSREDETDMVIAAEHITPYHIGRLHKDAGGLICVALSFDMARRLGLPYLTEVLQAASERYPPLLELANCPPPYGGKPAFSISINHRRTFTGITDRDRALTAVELAKICKRAMEDGADVRRELALNFRAPGHVHLLIASNGLLSERHGHTELSVYLAELAGLTPAVVICEMLDARSHLSLSWKAAEGYSRRSGFPFVDGSEILKHYRSWIASSVGQAPSAR